MARFEWTPGALARLAALAEAGATQGEMAEALGCSVVSVQKRLSAAGLRAGGRGRPRKHAPGARKPRPKKPKRARVVFLEVAPTQCVWPLWRRGERRPAAWFVCGAPKAPGAGSYCARHLARARRRSALVGFEEVDNES